MPVLVGRGGVAVEEEDSGGRRGAGFAVEDVEAVGSNVTDVSLGNIGKTTLNRRDGIWSRY